MSAAASAFDVAVVGGGLVGLATAHFLAEMGTSVVVLERGAPGEQGATPRSAGLVLTGLGDHPNRLAHGIGPVETAAVLAFTVENGRLLRALVERLGIECGYARPGSYAVAANPAELRDLVESMELLLAHRIECEPTFLDRGPLAAEKHAPRGSGAIRYGRDAVLDPTALVRGLAATLPKKYVTLRSNTAVKAIDATGARGGVRIEVAPADGGGAAGEVRAEIAIVATNAWAREVHAFFEDTVTPVRGQGFVTAPLPGPVLEGGASANWGHEMYRQLPDGRLLATGFNPGTRIDDVGFDDRPTDAFQAFLERFARERIANLPKDLKIERRFAGTCGHSRDGLPVVGAIPGLPKLVAACGFTMRGLSVGVATARAVARLVTEGGRDFPPSFGAARFL